MKNITLKRNSIYLNQNSISIQQRKVKDWNSMNLRVLLYFHPSVVRRYVAVKRKGVKMKLSFPDFSGFCFCSTPTSWTSVTSPGSASRRSGVTTTKSGSCWTRPTWWITSSWCACTARSCGAWARCSAHPRWPESTSAASGTSPSGLRWS